MGGYEVMLFCTGDLGSVMMGGGAGGAFCIYVCVIPRNEDYFLFEIIQVLPTASSLFLHAD